MFLAPLALGFVFLGFFGLWSVGVCFKLVLCQPLHAHTLHSLFLSEARFGVFSG